MDEEKRIRDMAVYRRGSSRTYWIRFQFMGKPVNRSARTTDKRRAEAFERKERERLLDEYHGGRAKISFNAAFARYCEEALPQLKPATAERYLNSFLKMEPLLDGKLVGSIDKKRIGELQAYRRRDGVSNATINRDMTALSSFLTHCVDWDYIEVNPFRTMSKVKLKEAAPRREYLSHEDEQKILTECAAHIKPMVIFAIETGLRLMEQMHLEWRDVSTKRKEIYVRESKTGLPRTVPLTDRGLLQILSQPQRLRCPLVFPSTTGLPYTQAPTGFKAARERAGLRHIRWHDLRKTCGTRLIQERGFKMQEVKEWLGHKSIVTTEKAYAFLDADDLHSALGRAKTVTPLPVVKKGRK